MPKIRLHQRGIERLTAGKWMTDYWDDRLPSFGVRVSPSGRKTYVVRYNFDGRKRRLTLGAYPILSLVEAREQARSAFHEIARGVDPQEKPIVVDALTFEELAEVYLERHAKIKKRCWREDERILRVDLLPEWGSLAADEIQVAEVVALLDEIVERDAPIMANRTKALISKIFNFGIGRGLVQHNPCFGVPMPSPEMKRSRVLTEREIRAIWRVLCEEDFLIGTAFKLRLLTAQRGNEVLQMQWSQLDEGWWTIPAETAKNGQEHRVPLSSQVQNLLARIQLVTGSSDWVFNSPRRPGQPINSVQKAAQRIARDSGVEFVPHDLRRTAATFMTSMGTPRLVVSKILNHVEQGVTAIYDRYDYDAEKWEALVRWGRRVEEIVGFR